MFDHCIGYVHMVSARHLIFESRTRYLLYLWLMCHISEKSTIVWIRSIHLLRAGMFHCIRSVSLQIQIVQRVSLSAEKCCTYVVEVQGGSWECHKVFYLRAG